MRSAEIVRLQQTVSVFMSFIFAVFHILSLPFFPSPAPSPPSASPFMTHFFHPLCYSRILAYVNILLKKRKFYAKDWKNFPLKTKRIESKFHFLDLYRFLHDGGNVLRCQRCQRVCFSAVRRGKHRQ